MKVLGFIASPRRDGNTEMLINKALEGAKDKGAETKAYYLDELNIEPCHACGTCGENIDCKINDDGSDLIEEILSADAILFGSPIYYGQMTSQGKLLTDRFYSISRNPSKDATGKKAALFFVHSAPTGVYDQYIELTKASPFGHIGLEVTDVLDVGQVSDPADVNKLPEIMEQAYNIGQNII